MRISSTDPLAARAVPAVIQPRNLTARQAKAINKHFGPAPTPPNAREACWLPLETPNTSNQREHWAVTAKRAKSQRSKLKREVGNWLLTSGPRLVITVTRTGPRRLDPPNLGSALKSVVDGIADALKVDDGAEWLEWRLEQAKGEPGVRWRMHWLHREPLRESEGFDSANYRGTP